MKTTNVHAASWMTKHVTDGTRGRTQFAAAVGAGVVLLTYELRRIGFSRFAELTRANLIKPFIMR